MDAGMSTREIRMKVAQMDLATEEEKVAARARVRVQIQDNVEVLALFVATSSMADCRVLFN